MNKQAKINALKTHFESLFPGKWISQQAHSTALLTGFREIDRYLPRGLPRQRITAWTGGLSSGKTTLLRAAIANWCANGFHVAYIDVENQLTAGDWCVASPAVSQLSLLPPLTTLFSAAQDAPLTVSPSSDIAANPPIPKSPGRLWIMRSDEENKSLRHSLWASDQLIRCHAFDVVILDLGTGKTSVSSHQQDRIFARLQTSLAQSNTSFLILKNTATGDSGWGCHTQLSFHWGQNPNYATGCGGIITISPTIICSIKKDGLSKTVEILPDYHASNRLFTHPPIPDRRTPKA